MRLVQKLGQVSSPLRSQIVFLSSRGSKLLLSSRNYLDVTWGNRCVLCKQEKLVTETLLNAFAEAAYLGRGVERLYDRAARAHASGATSDEVARMLQQIDNKWLSHVGVVNLLLDRALFQLWSVIVPR